MDRLQQIRLLADYNRGMNDKLYHCTAMLDEAVQMHDDHAFFGSLFDTLNHIVVGDTLWLKRFARHPLVLHTLATVDDLPTPASLTERQCTTLNGLRTRRTVLDSLIMAMSQELEERHLDHDLSYCNTRGEPQCKSFYALLTHFFNHQTHHRGQASTLLCQHGQDVGITDLLALIRDSTI